ncbi:peptidyl-prolyl cis-trans isomerase FKBP8-like isoform X2 [Monomorium pharaonis]|nr:peptidyl-prolyl cis-trans isomerase FKBP8 isoform X2 [Monomorium pharaonis]XP_028048981.1 peptidyl-prolyl cis-trans isomerase FKBP8 isoform X2 [Monomorium pharaonis]XP_036139104.1 peptidyl-prolyl cis-trans isomerase FKBP8 isoform X2 [Monomorium pharaonis]XP_036139105.1 peptidyl-prolyl cis-trans isomerase FKBP8 isoform X2 [Monomorium pharaonis]XP_036150192.1 peptidyl-prolyl cis-trans isomerase FKBP8-like isoform X2 [Monomorium pharaonis]XP_036150193.1 peptidyl-prolyl cis-trans isomerase FKBP
MDESGTPEKEIQADVPYKVSEYNDNSKDSAINPQQSSEKDLQCDSDDWLDILGNGQLKKKVIQKGEENVKPHNGDMCTIKMIGKLDDGTVVEDYNNLTIQIGDMEVIQGLDLTIILMELNEIAEILIHPRFAYGPHGNKSIPPDSTITYTVHLKAIEDEPEMETLSIEQRREIGNRKRERGNWWFIRKDLSFAIQCYRRALKYLQLDDDTKWNKYEETVPVTAKELQTLLDDSMKVYNNLAAALIETEAYDSALENVNRVLKYQPTNKKALLRKGKILKIKGEYSKAYLTFVEAQKLEPNMKLLQAELISLKEKVLKQNRKEKHLYAKMLGVNTNKSSKDVKVEDKRKIAKGILWTLLGASAAVVGGILVHRFIS